MKHARFYYFDGNGYPRQALGSDSVVVFDNHPGALTPRGRHNVAAYMANILNRKDGLDKCYGAYAIFTGASFTNSVPERYKLYPTSLEYVAMVEAVDLTDPNLWR